MFSLKNKHVVVTGGGRGIGRGITLAMADAGARVFVTGRSPEPLASVVDEIERAGGEAAYWPQNLRSLDGIETVVAKAIERFGYIDVWVNNAGSADPADIGPLIDLTEDQYDRVVDLNMKWAFFAAQVAARTMTRGGSIINISSRSGTQPCPITGHYGAAKAGIESLTATMAVEWGHRNIRVNAIAPGVVLTESAEATGMTNPRRIRRQIETIPLCRMGRVEDIGYLCVYLASDEAGWLTGEVVQATGGSRIPVGLLTYLWKVNEQAEREASGRAGAAANVSGND